jgi:hypothetical protein
MQFDTEYVTKDDLVAFESRIIVKLEELKLTSTDKPVYKTLTMFVADVQKKFGYSHHKHRMARRNQSLAFKTVGLSRFEYLRNHVETYIKGKQYTLL